MESTPFPIYRTSHFIIHLDILCPWWSFSLYNHIRPGMVNFFIASSLFIVNAVDKHNVTFHYEKEISQNVLRNLFFLWNVRYEQSDSNRTLELELELKLELFFKLNVFKYASFLWMGHHM